MPFSEGVQVKRSASFAREFQFFDEGRPVVIGQQPGDPIGVRSIDRGSLGLGIAVKCDDGASRAAEVVVATVIAALLGRSDAPELERFLRPVLTNWNRMTVGGLRPSAELVEAAATLAP